MPRKPLILVVEDDPGLAWATGCDLRASGYLAVLVSDGAAALDFATEVQVDLIVLDLMMPVMDGWRFLQKRKTDPDLRRIPVIVATSSYEDPQEVGPDVDAVLPKPLPRDVLVRSIEEALSRSRPTGK